MIPREVTQTVPPPLPAQGLQPSGEAAPLTGSKDDRGRPIERLSLKELKRTAERKNDPRAALARRIRDAVRAEARRQTPGRFFAGLGIVIGLNVLTTLVALAFPGFFWIRPIAFWILIAAFVFYMRWYISVAAAKNVSVTAVAEGVCGSCTYTLQDIVTEPDGCVVCPECGAAWRHERIVRPHWETDQTPFIDFQPPWYQRFFLAIPRAKDQLAPDDRGRFVRILDARMRLIAPQQRAVLGAERIRELRRATFRVGLVWRCLISVIPFLVAAGLLMGAITMLFAARRATDEAVMAVVMTVFAGVFALVGVGTIFSLSFRGPKRVTAVLRERSVCACCGHDLAGLAPDGMGMTACPTCRSGWRLPTGSVSLPVVPAPSIALASSDFAAADPIAPPNTPQSP